MAVGGVEFSCGYDFGEVFHVGWFYVDDVEGVVGAFEVPDVDSWEGREGGQGDVKFRPDAHFMPRMIPVAPSSKSSADKKV